MKENEVLDINIHEGEEGEKEMKTKKIIDTVKRNGKKIAIGAGILTLGVAGVVIGKKIGHSGSNDAHEALVSSVFETLEDDSIVVKEF